MAISLRRCRYGLLHRLIGPSASPSLNVSAVTSSNPSNGQSSPSSAPITEWHSALRLPVRSQRVGCAFFENASNVPSSSRPSEAPTMLSCRRSRPHALFLALVSKRTSVPAVGPSVSHYSLSPSFVTFRSCRSISMAHRPT